MKIIHVPRRFVRSHWGGTETVILETCKRLRQEGHETLILCPNALADEYEEVIEGIPVRRVPYFYPYFGLTDDARALLDRKGGNLFSVALLKALKNEPQVDLIHLHTGKRVGGIGRYVADIRGIPYVISLHGGLFDVPQQEAATWTEPTRGAIEWGKILGWWVGSRRVMDDAAAILCVGREEMLQTQRRYPRKRVVHLPNGVDADRFASGDGTSFRRNFGIPLDATVLLTVGRIDPQKNQMFMVKTVSDLIDLHPKLHYLIIGPSTNDDYDREVVRFIEERGLESSVTVIHGLEAGSKALVDAYHAADVFVLPSIHEPFGIVILEAWAAGLPVIACRVGGIPSFVEDGRDGLLFNPDDGPSFVKALRRIMEQPEEAARLAEAGRNKARVEYGWDVITDRLVAVYEEARREYPVRQ